LEPRRRDKHQAETPEQHSGTGRAIVIGPYLRERATRENAAEAEIRRSPDARLDEAVGLAHAIDLEIVESGIVPLSQIRPAT
jgi:GTP-binding protein HflX